MQYLLLIFGDESSGPHPGTPEFETYMQGYIDFTEKVRAEGKLVGGEALQPVSTAKTVTVRNGNTKATDGPFAETKEQLGGYYLLDCESQKEAETYAAIIPDAKSGHVEVRPVVVWE